MLTTPHVHADLLQERRGPMGLGNCAGSTGKEIGNVLATRKKCPRGS